MSIEYKILQSLRLTAMGLGGKNQEEKSYKKEIQTPYDRTFKQKNKDQFADVDINCQLINFLLAAGNDT